jgi:hypothetical protein
LTAKSAIVGGEDTLQAPLRFASFESLKGAATIFNGFSIHALLLVIVMVSL